MGCDIHAHIEIKLADGRWLHWNHLSIPRNYAFFGLLAGVRSDELDPIAQPRGFPEDATETTRLDYEHWQVDHHTPSWLTSQEIGRADEAFKSWLKNQRNEGYWCIEQWIGYVFGNGPGDIHKYPDEFGPAKDCRLVFWFDN